MFTCEVCGNEYLDKRKRECRYCSRTRCEFCENENACLCENYDDEEEEEE
jgi:hypothetical protein